MKWTLAAATASIAIGLGLVGRDARAACGFYTAPAASTSASALVNDADQVSLMREGTRFALTMSTNYKGPAEDFAMIVPVPVVLAKENVKTLSPDIFTHLEQLTAPRLVEYDEADPCPKAQITGSNDGLKGAAPGGGLSVSGGGGGGGLGVKVEAQFVVGEYEIVVLSAKESDGLETWLKEHAYKIPDGAAAALAPYVAQQQKFVVAKVDATKVHKDLAGTVVLSPLRFVYETNDFRLPVRLGLLNAPEGKKQDVIVYLLAKKTRLESANLPNVLVPTNVDVGDDAIASFTPFYASLLDATMASAKTNGAVAVTEYAFPASECGAPCNTTGLGDDEVGKLGADELAPSTAPGIASQLVLTRLHTRYDKSTLQEDIVFRDAPPIAGGMEGYPGAEAAPVATTVNAFQARYTVRHPWKGDVACDAPTRGVWEPTPRHTPPAMDLASAPRDVKLASLVKSPIPALGLALDAPPYAAKPNADAKGSKDGKGLPGLAREMGTTTWMYGVGGALVLAIGAWMLLRKR